MPLTDSNSKPFTYCLSARSSPVHCEHLRVPRFRPLFSLKRNRFVENWNQNQAVFQLSLWCFRLVRRFCLSVMNLINWRFRQLNREYGFISARYAASRWISEIQLGPNVSQASLEAQVFFVSLWNCNYFFINFCENTFLCFEKFLNGTSRVLL